MNSFFNFLFALQIDVSRNVNLLKNPSFLLRRLAEKLDTSPKYPQVRSLTFAQDHDNFYLYLNHGYQYYMVFRLIQKYTSIQV